MYKEVGCKKLKTMEKEMIAVAYEILLFRWSHVHFLVPPPPPPQALRLFFFHRGERETSVTGDEAPLRPFSPSRLSLRPNFHREKDAWTQLFET